MKACHLALLLALVPLPSFAATESDWAAFLAAHSFAPQNPLYRSADLEVFRSSDGLMTLYRLATPQESSIGELVRWYPSGGLSFDARDGGEAMHVLASARWPHFESGLRDPDVAWIRQAVNRTLLAGLDDLEGTYVTFGFGIAPRLEEVDVRSRTEFAVGPPLRRHADGFREAVESNMIFHSDRGRVLTLRLRSLRAEGLVQSHGPSTQDTRASYSGRRYFTGDSSRELHRISEAVLTERSDSPRLQVIDVTEMRFLSTGRDSHEAWRLLRLAVATNVASEFDLSEIAPDMVHRIVNTNRLIFLIQFPDETMRPPLLISEETTRRLTQVRVERLADAGATLGLQPGMSIQFRFAAREPLEVRSIHRTKPLSWTAIMSTADEAARAHELRQAIAAVPLTRLRAGLVRVQGPMTFTAHSPSEDPVTQAMTELAAHVASVDRELNRLFEIVAIDRRSTVAPFNAFARTLRDLIQRGQPLRDADAREIALRSETLRARHEELRTRLSDSESLAALIGATESWVGRVELAVQNTETRHRPVGDAWPTLAEASRQQRATFRTNRTREVRVLRDVIMPGLLAEQRDLLTTMILAQDIRMAPRVLPPASNVCRNFFVTQ